MTVEVTKFVPHIPAKRLHYRDDVAVHATLTVETDDVVVSGAKLIRWDDGRWRIWGPTPQRGHKPTFFHRDACAEISRQARAMLAKTEEGAA